ncbi:MAG: precorrin-8X methylmutase [Deltaproteobacteria bacterium]|nr:precorrin-8X methylmutase [Deltaproteobacteria bacterium]
MKPSDIETLSFKIIDKEAGEHNFSQKEWPIVRRMIHTSADFDYMKTVRFHPLAIEAAINAMQHGKTIITDTKMAMSGISKKKLEGFNVKIKCLISDTEIGKKAAEKKTTRAHAAVDAAVLDMEGGIYVIGNAPTALLHLIELVETGKAAPALIIGLPVGFVNAAESKAALIKTDYPYITNIGRKGGSNIAASVINAFANIAKGEH